MKRKEEILDPKTVKLETIDRYDAEAIFRYLLRNNWEIIGWKPEEEQLYNIQMISPEGRRFSLNQALYYVVNDKIPEELNKNIYHLMKESNFDMNIFQRFQHLSSHLSYKGREDFISNVIQQERVA